MRIDSGLNGYYYQGRYQHDQADLDESANDTTTKTRARTSTPSVSSTLLSPSLSSALWVIEGGKASGRDDAAKALATETTSVVEQVEALYLEYAEDEA